jgi:2-amino-4-hydroxy-6-hydroxymethyldihydropteridine diphosphokinase
MILIGLGGNLSSPVGAPPVTFAAALAQLEAAGTRVEACSNWYESAPVPVSDQPWFVNGVVRVTSDLGPEELLALLHRTEGEFGRVRHVPNGSRTLDLDLLAYGDLVRQTGAPILPHPRLHERAFVLLPLKDVAPNWRHPVLGLTPAALMEKIPPGQLIRSLEPKPLERNGDRA